MSEHAWCVAYFVEVGLSKEAARELVELLDAFEPGGLAACDYVDQIQRFAVGKARKRDGTIGTTDVAGQMIMWAPNGARNRWA